MDKLLAKLRQDLDQAADHLSRSRADQWEIMGACGNSSSVALRGLEVDKFQEAASLGLAVRVIHRDRVGFSYAMGPQGDDLARLAEEALASAAASDPVPGYGFPEQPRDLAPVDTYDPAVAADPPEAKLARAKAMAEAALGADPRITHVQPAEYGTAQSHTLLRNSLGLNLEHRATSVSAGVVAMASENGQSETAWESDGVCYLSDIDPTWLGTEAGKKAAAYLGAGPVPDGRYDLVLDQSISAYFLGLLASSLLGDNLVKGRSLLADKLGQMVISPAVTISDDGLYPRGQGTAPFDDEGTPQDRRDLIEAGALKSFVCDRLWGLRAGLASTGNSVRGGLKAPPGVGFTNLILRPGQGDQMALAAQSKKALIITEIMGGHTADPISGEFSLGAAGHLTEDGQIVRAVKGIAIAGQILDFFGQVKAVGEDLRFFGRSAAPSLLVGGVSVSGPRS